MPGKVPSPGDLRAEVERLVVGDLLGPAGGQDETLSGSERVCNRYLILNWPRERHWAQA